MNNTIVYNITDLRTNLFEIINLVYYQNKIIKIMKNNRPMATIAKDISPAKPKKSILDFAGCLTDKEDYRIMKKAVRDLRKGKERATPIHKL